MLWLLIELKPLSRILPRVHHAGGLLAAVDHYLLSDCVHLQQLGCVGWGNLRLQFSFAWLSVRTHLRQSLRVANLCRHLHPLRNLGAKVQFFLLSDELVLAADPILPLLAGGSLIRCVHNPRLEVVTQAVIALLRQNGGASEQLPLRSVFLFLLALTLNCLPQKLMRQLANHIQVVFFRRLLKGCFGPPAQLFDLLILVRQAFLFSLPVQFVLNTITLLIWVLFKPAGLV